MNGFYAAPSDGSFNTALGKGSLANNTGGSYNTANGVDALQFNTTGDENTASGASALSHNTTGAENTASGVDALYTNTTGSYNTAVGIVALANNTNGGSNTAVGDSALYFNGSGSYNTAVGLGALENSSGSNNIAIGYYAGHSFFNLGAGGNNIQIGNQGAADDNGVIRIGFATAMPNCTPACGPQTSFFAAGITGTTTGLSGAVPVVIDANGQLGTVSSSRRYKDDIQDMGDASSGLLRLRPVTFRYKQAYQDGSKPVDYGLIAEEVAEVYPDLVAHSLDGKIETVRCQKLNAMLLNEVQKQHREIEEQGGEMRAEIGALKARLSELQDLLENFAAPK